MKRSLEPDEVFVEGVVDKKLLTVLRHVPLSLSLRARNPLDESTSSLLPKRGKHFWKFVIDGSSIWGDCYVLLDLMKEAEADMKYSLKEAICHAIRLLSSCIFSECL